MKNVIIFLLALMSVIAFWQPSTRESSSAEIVTPEETEAPVTAIYTDSLVAGLYATFGGVIQVEKEKKQLFLSYNPHKPQFHRTPLHNSAFVNMYSNQDHQTEGADEEVTISFSTQGDSIVLVPNELLCFIIDRYHIIQR